MATRRKSAESEAREDAIRQYLDEIGAYRLLTAADEVDLAKAIEKGQQAQEALDQSGTTPTPNDASSSPSSGAGRKPVTSSFRPIFVWSFPSPSDTRTPGCRCWI